MRRLLELDIVLRVTNPHNQDLVISRISITIGVTKLNTLKTDGYYYLDHIP